LDKKGGEKSAWEVGGLKSGSGATGQSGPSLGRGGDKPHGEKEGSSGSPIREIQRSNGPGIGFLGINAATVK